MTRRRRSSVKVYVNLTSGREVRSLLGKRAAAPVQLVQKLPKPRRTREDHIFALSEVRMVHLAEARQRYSLKETKDQGLGGDFLWRKKTVESFVKVREELHTPKPVMIIGNPSQSVDLAAQQQKLLRNRATFTKVFQGVLKLPPKDSILRELLASDNEAHSEVLLRWIMDSRQENKQSQGPLTLWQAKWVYALLACLLPPFGDDTHALVHSLFCNLREESVRFEIEYPQSIVNYEILLTLMVNSMLTPDTW